MSAFVQRVKNHSNTNVTTLTATWAGNTVTGNEIILTVGYGIAVGSITSITDSQSNTYTNVISGNAGGNNVQIWKAENITGGTTPTITITLSGLVVQPIIIAEEWSGFRTSSSSDQTATNTSNDSSPTATTSSTTAVNETVFAGIIIDTVTASVGSGYSNFSSEVTTGNKMLAMESKTVTSAGAQTATFGLSGSAIWVVDIGTFVDAVQPVTLGSGNRLLMGVG